MRSLIGSALRRASLLFPSMTQRERTGMDQAVDKRDPASPAGDETSGSMPVRQWRTAARTLLVVALLGLGIYMLQNYIRALVWAVVLAIAIWPLFDRTRKRAPRLPKDVLPIVFTVVVGIVFLLPFALLAIEAVREAHQIVDFAKQAEQNGVPVPDFVSHLPYGAKQVTDWWNANLAHAGWLKETAERIDTTSNRELGRSVGKEALHRAVLFGFCLLALFFLFKSGEAVIAQCLVASERLFGPRGERVGRQMVASIHGTVNGLVLVGIGEGVVLGVVYYFTHVPHPILFGALTAVAAMIPFAAAIAFLLAALLVLGTGGVVPAIIVVVAGFVVTFTADHFVRPTLIGGATKLPFLWVLLGILGGVETFGLLGLFLGPATMAALILLWRDYTEPGARPA